MHPCEICTPGRLQSTGCMCVHPRSWCYCFAVGEAQTSDSLPSLMTTTTVCPCERLVPGAAAARRHRAHQLSQNENPDGCNISGALYVLSAGLRRVGAGGRGRLGQWFRSEIIRMISSYCKTSITPLLRNLGVHWTR